MDMQQLTSDFVFKGNDILTDTNNTTVSIVIVSGWWPNGRGSGNYAKVVHHSSNGAVEIGFRLY